jgi:hypothetical protein
MVDVISDPGMDCPSTDGHRPGACASLLHCCAATHAGCCFLSAGGDSQLPDTVVAIPSAGAAPTFASLQGPPPLPPPITPSDD